MKLGKRQQARRVPPPPPVQEAMPPPRQPMASFATGPYDMPPPGYAPDGSPTMGYAPDGMAWMGPPPDGPPSMGYGPAGMPWVPDGPGGFPPMAYAYAPDGTPVLYGTEGLPPGSVMDGPPSPYGPGPDLTQGYAPPGYEATQAYAPPPAYDGQHGYAPPGYDATQAEAPQQAYEPPPSYDATQGYAPQQAYAPPPAYDAQQAYDPQPAYEPPPGYDATQPAYAPRPEPAPDQAQLSIDPEPAGPVEPARSDIARPQPAIAPEQPQVTWEPEAPAGASEDVPPWPDFAPINRTVDEDGSPGVERLPTATQAHRLRLERPIDHVATHRTAEARLARLHLRGGMLELARASLEQLAGVGTLDREALADLAETRWRNGDLEGAAEAAEAHLRAHGDEPMPRVVAAEWAAHDGRILDARQLATQVQGQVGEGLDRLFAGEPRSAVWPPAVPGWMDAGAADGGRFGLLVGGAEVADADAATWVTAQLVGAEDPRSSQASSMLVHTAQHAPPIKVAPQDAAEAEREADRELQAAERDLARGDLAALADRLGLLLRRDPGLAPVILAITEHALAVGAERTGATSAPASGQGPGAAVGPSAPVPGLASLQMLRGDILRGLGHETDATQAYQQALRALPGRTSTREST